MDRAASLPDGTKVFKNAQGEVVTLDGEKVDPVLADTIIWKGNEPLHEEAAQSDDLLSRLEGHKARIDGITVDIADGQNTLEDTKNGGLTSQGFDGLQGQLDGFNSDLDSLESEVAKAERELNDNGHELSTSSATPMIIPDFET